MRGAGGKKKNLAESSVLWVGDPASGGDHFQAPLAEIVCVFICFVVWKLLPHKETQPGPLTSNLQHLWLCGRKCLKFL